MKSNTSELISKTFSSSSICGELRFEFWLLLIVAGICARKKRRRVADSGALSPALRACSALNEWERRAQCLLDKPTPIGHSLH